MLNRQAPWALILMVIGLLPGLLPAQTVQRDVFDSGLTLVIAERHQTPVAVVQAYLRAGPAYEGRLLGTGISALAQRIQLNHAPPPVIAAQRRSGSQIEADLGVGQASYRLVTTGDRVDDALRAMAQLLNHTAVSDDALQRERERLLQEQEQAQADPERLLRRAVLATVYQQHPARLPLIGRRDSLLALTRTDVQTYLEQRCTAANLVLVVTGNVEAHRVRRTVRSAFAYFPEGSFDRGVQAVEPPQVTSRRAIIPARIPNERVALAFRSEDLAHPDLPALTVLAEVLDAPASPLRRRLEGDQLVSDLRVCHRIALGRPGYFEIAYEVRVDRANAALNAVNEVLTDLKRDPNLLALALPPLVKRLEREYRSADILALTEELGRWELAVNDPLYGEEAFRQSLAVGAEELQRLLGLYLRRSRLSRITLRPRADEQPAGTSGPLPKPLSSVPPVVERFDNGLRLIMQNTDRGLVELRISLGGGPSLEEDHNRGVTALLAQSLGHATEQYDAAALRQRLDAAGMALQVDYEVDALHLGVTCFPEDAHEALGLAIACLVEPVFDGEALEARKRAALAALAVDSLYQDWQTRILDRLRRTLLAGHYAAQPIAGTAESLPSLDRTALMQQLATLWRGSNVIISVLGGPFDGVALRELIRVRLVEDGHLPAGNPQRVVGTPPPPLQPTNHALTTGRPESGVGRGWRIGVPPSAWDQKAAMDVLVALLGGADGSGGRLGRALRNVPDGAVVDSRLVLERYDRRDLVLLAVLVAEPQLDTVRKLLDSELQRLLEDLESGVESRVQAMAEELLAAKALCRTRLSLTYENPAAVARRYARAMLIEDGLDNVLGYAQQLDAVTLPQVRELVRGCLLGPACAVQLTPRLPNEEPASDETIDAIIDEAKGERKVVTGSPSSTPTEPPPPPPSP